MLKTSNLGPGPGILVLWASHQRYAERPLWESYNKALASGDKIRYYRTLIPRLWMLTTMANPWRVSEAVSLALHATALLASKPGRSLSTRDIAGRLGASEAHLAKVLQRLSKAGLTTSTVGPKGGHMLARPGGEVSLQEVYETIEGPLTPLKCLFGKPVCIGEFCIFGNTLEDVDATLRDWLANTRLSDVSRVFEAEKA